MILSRFLNIFWSGYIAESKVGYYWADDAVFQPLLAYDRPGNIRELDNFAERMALLSKSVKIELDHLNALLNMFHFKNKLEDDSLTLPMLNDLRVVEREYLK